MPLPVLEQIAENVEAALRQVRIINGYNCDASVIRRSVAGDPQDDNVLIVTQGDPPKQDDTPQDVMEWMQPFLVMCWVRESESSTIPIDRRLNLLCCDVEKAMMVDPHRGGLAIDTIPRVKMYFTATDGSGEAIEYQFDVHYRTRLGDPFTRAG
jgi:hypothetical protein